MVISFLTTHRQDSPDSNTNRPACSQLLKHNINTNKSYEYYILPYTYINTITIIYYIDEKCRKKVAIMVLKQKVLLKFCLYISDKTNS